LIVAAGIIGPRPLLPVYNGLRIIDIALGLLTISFTGFSPPRGGRDQYIVKAMPQLTVAGERRTSPVLVNFGGFSTTVGLEGIQLAIVTPDGVPAPADTIKSTTFVIEVSQFSA
jgi:hypothetical protein